MKITAYTAVGIIAWDEPDNFNFMAAIATWRSSGFIQSPTFYVSMNSVALITVGDQVKPQPPQGHVLQ